MTISILGRERLPDARDERSSGDAWLNSDNLYNTAMTDRSLMLMQPSPPALTPVMPSMSKEAPPIPPSPNVISVPTAGLLHIKPIDIILMLRSTTVKSFRAFRLPNLAQAAQALAQHFLYATC